MIAMEQEIVSLPQAAKELGTSKEFIRQYILHPDASQRLPAHRIGKGTWRIYRADFEAFKKRITTKNK